MNGLPQDALLGVLSQLDIADWRALHACFAWYEMREEWAKARLAALLGVPCALPDAYHACRTTGRTHLAFARLSHARLTQLWLCDSGDMFGRSYILFASTREAIHATHCAFARPDGACWLRPAGHDAYVYEDEHTTVHVFVHGRCAHMEGRRHGAITRDMTHHELRCFLSGEDPVKPLPYVRPRMFPRCLRRSSR